MLFRSPGLHTPDPLALALANSPSLRLVRARRPTLLNTFLVELARNPVLRRIELLDEKDAERRYGVGGSGVVEFGEPDVEGGMLGMEMGTGMSGWIGGGGNGSTGGMGGGGGGSASASASSFGLDDVEAYEEDSSLPPSPSSPASRILSYSLLNYQSAFHRAHQQQQSSPVLTGSNGFNGAMNGAMNGANGQPLSPASQLREAVMPQVMRMNNVDTDVLERARKEVASEPQTLFAAQAVAHPRLRALTQAGRLQVVYDRLLVEKEREKEREMGKERGKQEEKQGKDGEKQEEGSVEPILTTTTPVLAVEC